MTTEIIITGERKTIRLLEFFAKGGRIVRTSGKRFKVLDFDVYYNVMERIHGGLIVKRRGEKCLLLRLDCIGEVSK
jgi:hypothetical protein